MEKNYRTDLILQILRTIEEEKRPGLENTPHRVDKLYTEMFDGYDRDPKSILKTRFPTDHKEMVILREIDFYSHCEHHLVPFFGKVHIGYIPKKEVVGISKLARLVECFAHRLQIQEKMTSQIANAIMENLDCEGVGVVIEAQHLCMAMRGIKKLNAITVTSAVRGTFKENLNVRTEFLNLIKV